MKFNKKINTRNSVNVKVCANRKETDSGTPD